MSLPRAASRTAIRWKPAAGIVVLFAILVVLAVFAVPDPQMNVLLPQLLIPLGLATLWIWYAFFSHDQIERRTMIAALMAVAATIFFATYRIKGLDGDFWLILEARGVQAASSATLASEVGSTSANGIDLASTTPDDYPQFLGPNRNGRVVHLELNPDWRSRPPKELWRRTIGDGWSSFAVVGPYAVTQEQRDGIEWVACYEVATGRLAWATRGTPGFGATAYEVGIAGKGPRATPTVRDGRVYVYGSLGVLACLDGATGREIWKRDVTAELGTPIMTWGMSASPLVLEETVVVTTGGTNNNALVAYDRATGAPRWAAGSDPASYCSPSVSLVNGQPVIVMLNKISVTGHDPATGSVLWRTAWQGDETKVAQPQVIEGNRIFVSSGYGEGCALYQVEAGGADGVGPIVNRLWHTMNMRTKFTTAVIRHGFAYGLDEGMLSCIDLSNGERTWKKSRGAKYGHGQVVLVGDTLVVQCEQPGDVALVAADPKEFRELGRVSALSDKTWNCPAVAGKYLLVRNDREAVCFELALADEGHPATAHAPIDAEHGRR